MKTNTYVRFLISVGFAVATLASANASSYNYMFPDGSGGFALTSSGWRGQPRCTGRIQSAARTARHTADGHFVFKLNQSGSVATAAKRM